MDEPIELIPTVYTVGESELTVELRGDGRWAICHMGFCYSREHGDFENEPLPSNRDEEFLARTRFTLAEAKEVATRLAPQYPNRRNRR